MDDYNYHTINKEIEEHKIKATQRYTFIGGEPHFIGDFRYSIVHRGHIVSLGTMMGSMGKLTEEKVVEVLQGYLDDKKRYASL